MSHFKAGISGFAVLVGFIAFLALASLGGYAWMHFIAPIKGKAEAEMQIESKESRIGNYEHFFDLCAVIQGNEATLAAQQAALATASGDEAQRYRANVAAISSQRQRNIARYNADARKAYTRARFLGESLPKRINPSNESTQCENY